MVSRLFFFFRKKRFCFENGEKITTFDRMLAQKGCFWKEKIVI